MSPTNSQRLSRIGIFYDGNYFRHIGNYYSYVHPKRAKINVGGLHNFIRARVAAEEGTDVKFTQIVDAHYFRGRVKAREAEERDILFSERSFEDVLMYEGITTHYLPMGRDGEKGVDVWLALEAFEMAVYKRFDVLALVAADGDFVPLARKLNTLGTRVMLLSWDFSYTDQNGNLRETRTSQALMGEVTYPLAMADIIDNPQLQHDPAVAGLLYRPDARAAQAPSPAPVAVAAPTAAPPEVGSIQQGRIANLKETYGFILPDAGGPNVFFPFSALPLGDPQRLRDGMRVSFEYTVGDRGPIAPKVWILLNQD
ncbi:NYN domain-containing protein [Azohydromonas caseinilytica]|uniref:NYN domain-containing protein n=1 Tax=Azohydromonas caseinilytica TaxID=2728836 RepID=A0A848FFV7_9BURK|nr:NYN domain-containing protein [Azohydromonas caseinilytica]NML17133.1 NYN domain-containing protein [Azohydromonas caseinilytica]